MKVNQSEFNSRWSELHGGAVVEGSIAIWLRISYWIARGLSSLRISPNAMTLFGVLLSFSLLTPVIMGDEIIPPYQSLFILIFALICDGVDGSLAIYQNRVTAMGALYDSIADRISEAFWLTFVVYIGIPARYAMAIWILGATQEYARARLAGLGFSEVGVITPTERPMRAIYVAVIIALNIFMPSTMTAASIIFVILQAISVLLIAKMARSLLR